MSDADALMWNIEKDPLLRSTILTVMVFDRPLDRDRLHRRIDRVSRLIPRLRQRVRGHTLSIAPPAGTSTRTSTSTTTCASCASPAPAPLREVFDIAAPIAMQGFDRARPLWEFTVVEGLDGDRSALDHQGPPRHHRRRRRREAHDGDARPRARRRGEDDELHLPPAPDPVTANEPPAGGRRARLRGPTPDRQRHQGALGSLAREAGRAAPRPVRRRHRRRSRTAGSVARMVSPAGEPLSPLMVDRSLSVRFDTLQVPLGVDEEGVEARRRSAQRRVRRRRHRRPRPATTAAWASTSTSCA